MPGINLAMDSSLLTATIVFKELVVAASAGTGAVVAVLGLGAWRKQLKGESEYQLAKNILRKLYEYRDAIYRVRHIAMWAHEMPNPPDEQAETMTPAQIRFYGRQKAYEKRWQKVDQCRSALYPDILEAEVLWDNELTDKLQPINNLESDLLISIQQQLELENPDVPQESKEHLNNQEEHAKRREMLYRLSTRPDPFGEEFESHLNDISAYLKGHLRK